MLFYSAAKYHLLLGNICICRGIRNFIIMIDILHNGITHFIIIKCRLLPRLAERCIINTISSHWQKLAIKHFIYKHKNLCLIEIHIESMMVLTSRLRGRRLFILISAVKEKFSVSLYKLSACNLAVSTLIFPFTDGWSPCTLAFISYCSSGFHYQLFLCCQ